MTNGTNSLCLVDGHTDFDISYLLPIDQLTNKNKIMLIGNFEALKKAGCIQCEHDSLRLMFHALMAATFRHPCTIDCPAFKDGKCSAYQQFNTDAKLRRAEDEKRERAGARALEDATTPHHGTGKWAGMTIRQIAKAEGISLNEARRRKQQGKYVS